jgi:hypothetical protein
MPDGLFSNQKLLEGPAMEHVGIFYVHLVYLCILRPSEIVYGHLVYFSPFWYIFPRFGMLYQEKSGNPEHDSAAWRGVMQTGLPDLSWYMLPKP